MHRLNLHFINHATFNNYLVSTYYVPGTTLDTGDIIVNKIGTNVCPYRIYNLPALWVYKHLKTSFIHVQDILFNVLCSYVGVDCLY